MIYIESFKNYEEFKKMFAIVEHGNGVKSRKNKILLSCLKDRKFIKRWLEFRSEFLKYAHTPEELTADILNIHDMIGLKNFIKSYIGEYLYKNDLWCRLGSLGHRCALIPYGYLMYSRTYSLDRCKGLCEDGDTRAIRYFNEERQKTYKMKAGKFITSCIEDNEFTRVLPESAKRWIAEEFAKDWQAYAEEKIGESNKLTLHVGSSMEDFCEIYEKDNYTGDFGSCMADEGQYYFYVDAVDASAACLKNTEGYIVARCVIFNSVMDEDGRIWRLAERQYSEGQNDVLKQVLVNKLISEGLIDGYKKVGVDCHDNRNFISVNGESLREKKFSIDCNLSDGDTLSYQDSFVYYNINENVAYNYESCNYTHELDTTDSTFDGHGDDEMWSELEQEYIYEDSAVYDTYNESYIHRDNSVDAIYRGEHIALYENSTYEFFWSEYENCLIYEEECVYAESRNDYILKDDAVRDINDNWQLSDDCVWSEVENNYILEEDTEWSNLLGDNLLRSTAIYSELLDDFFPDKEGMKEAEANYREKHALMCVPA